MRDEIERKMELVRSALRDHHAGVEPDPGFVSRVRARLPASSDPLRWAAVRLLPAGVALALVLGIMVWRELPARDVAPVSVDELATWMIDPRGENAP